jgi:hypothetical protein
MKAGHIESSKSSAIGETNNLLFHHAIRDGQKGRLMLEV